MSEQSLGKTITEYWTTLKKDNIVGEGIWVQRVIDNVAVQNVWEPRMPCRRWRRRTREYSNGMVENLSASMRNTVNETKMEASDK